MDRWTAKKVMNKDTDDSVDKDTRRKQEKRLKDGNMREKDEEATKQEKSEGNNGAELFALIRRERI